MEESRAGSRPTGRVTVYVDGFNLYYGLKAAERLPVARQGHSKRWLVGDAPGNLALNGRGKVTRTVAGTYSSTATRDTSQ